MVQYIPGPAGSFPYPNAGKGELQYEMMGKFGQGLGNLLSSTIEAKKQSDYKKQQDQWLNMTVGDLMGKMDQPQQPDSQPLRPTGQPPIGASGYAGRPVPGPTGYVPPGGGPNSRMVPVGQSPMMMPSQSQTSRPRPTLTMRDFAMMQKYSPYLAQRLAQTLPPPQKQIQKLPPETFYVNPATGEPSLSAREGYVPQMAPPGTGVKALTQWHYRKILEGDKDARLHLSKTIQDSRIADTVNKQLTPVDNALETYRSLLKLRSSMSKKSLDNVQDIIKNPNPNFLVGMLRGKDPDATDYYNHLLAAKNSLKGIAINKVSGGKELNDLATLLPDGSEDVKGLNNKMMAFNRAADILRAKAIASARIREAGIGMSGDGSMVDQMTGLPNVGDLEVGETSDFSDANKELGL